MSEDILDCIVVGLGGHGSATVAQIAQRNKKVMGIEQFERGHARGSSHGKSRIIRLAYFEDPRYVPFLRRSYELWRDLASFEFETNPEISENSGESILNMTGGLMIGKQDSTLVKGVLLSSHTHNLEYELLSASEIRARFPAFHPSPDEVAVYETQAGYLVPERCIEAYLKIAEQSGAILRHKTIVESWEIIPNQEGEGGGGGGGRDLIRVRLTSGETHVTKKLVLTVGAWAPEMFGSSLPSDAGLRVERRVLHWFEPLVEHSSNQHQPEPTPCISEVEGENQRGGGTTYSSSPTLPGSPSDVFKRMPIYIWDLGDQGNFYGFPESPSLPHQVKIALHLTQQRPHDPTSLSTLANPNPSNPSFFSSATSHDVDNDNQISGGNGGPSLPLAPPPSPPPSDRVYVDGLADLSPDSSPVCDPLIPQALRPETLNRSLLPGEVDTMRSVFQSRLPLLNGRWVDSVVCMYTMTSDENFIIDFHPSSRSVILASPCSGHGFKFCSVIGEILSDLATQGDTRHDLSLFSLSRFGSHSGSHSQSDHS